MPSPAHGSLLYKLEKAPGVALHLGVQDKEDLHGRKDIIQSMYLQYKGTTNMEPYLHYLRNNPHHRDHLSRIFPIGLILTSYDSTTLFLALYFCLH
jgi:hypothetical protein